MPIQNLASISIDVDGIDCYHSIHGLSPLHKGEVDPIYEKALPRFLDAMDAMGCRATLFVVGKDLEHPKRRALLKEAVARGHELASHSYAHDYKLSQKSPAEMDADLSRAADLIFEVSGHPPRGFRAPGYNQSEALFDALERQNIRYDSSFFPTPAYFAARAAALLKYKIIQKNSHSLRGDLREFLAQRRPFWPDKEKRFHKSTYKSSARSFVELPMTVATPLRMPWLGTTLALFPDAAGLAMTKAILMRRQPVILELHAMEFLGKDDGVREELIKVQPDLQVNLNDKLRRLQKTFLQLKNKRQLILLEEMASAFENTQ